MSSTAKSSQQVQDADIKAIMLLPVSLILTGLIYSFGLPGVFQLDDFHNLAPTLLREFDLAQLVQVLSTNSSGIFGRPVSVLSFTLSGLAHGDGPWGYKYHNILIHLTCGLLVFLLVRKTTQQLSPQRSDSTNWFALTICLIWLLHPLQVSTVLYVVQRMTQLSALFTLMALLTAINCYSSLSNFRKWLGYFLLFPLLMILALLSKENAVLIPVFLMVYCVCLVSAAGNSSRPAPDIADKIFCSLFVALPLLLGCVLLFLKFGSITDYSSRDHTMVERLLSQIHFVAFYIKQLVLPQLSQMGLFFDDVPLPKRFDWTLALKATFLLGLLTSGIVALFKGRVLFAFGILFYFSGHLLESTFVALEPAFEHRNYLPSLGIFISLGAAVQWLAAKHRVVKLIVPAWLILLVVLLGLRASFWSDGRNWQLTTLAYHPKSERTWISYIYDLRKSGLKSDAVQAIDHAAEILPDRLSFRVLKLLATCSSSTPEQNANTIDTIYQLVSTRPLTIIGFNNLAMLVNKTVTQPCDSISNSQVYIYVNAAINFYETAGFNSTMLGYLYTLMAKLQVFSADPLAAETHYRRAFELIGDPPLLLAAARALITYPQTRAKGLSLLNEIKNNRYFYSAIYNHDIEVLEQQIAAEDYLFDF